MQVRCCLIHMEMSGEHTQSRIPFLKTFHIFIQYPCRDLPFGCFCSHIILIPDLQDNLMEWFFLLSRADLFVIISNLPIFPCLLCVIPFKRSVKQFMVHLPDILIAVFHIPVAPFRIGILRMEFSAVMVDRTFPCHKADCPLQ